jgi:hypothetical protein
MNFWVYNQEAALREMDVVETKSPLERGKVQTSMRSMTSQARGVFPGLTLSPAEHSPDEIAERVFICPLSRGEIFILHYPF